MTEVAIGRARDTDLAEILEDFPRFWGDRAGPRALHHPMFVIEFGDTAFVARRDGQILAYLLGFVAPPATLTSTSSRSATMPAAWAWPGGCTRRSPRWLSPAGRAR